MTGFKAFLYIKLGLFFFVLGEWEVAFVVPVSALEIRVLKIMRLRRIWRKERGEARGEGVTVFWCLCHKKTKPQTG
jgi:hypothetical protein